MPPRTRKAHEPTLQCFCDGYCPDNLINGTCETRTGGSCFSSVEEVMDEITGYFVLERTYGCMPPEESGGFLQCKIGTAPQLHGKNIQCCDEKDFCNKNLHPKYTQRTTPSPPVPSIDDTTIHYIAFIWSMLVSLTILIVYVICRRRKHSKKNNKNNSDCESNLKPLSNIIEQSSGSGRGIPILVQQTIAKQIQKQHSIGKGRYGEVFLGKFRDENVAVKFFFATEEDSWLRETTIYKTVLMRHKNILGFIAADTHGTGSWTGKLIITDYHESGSLHDYLQRTALQPIDLKCMAYSLASGLEYLHNDILGNSNNVDLEHATGKSAIAHCDINSKNILVKSNGECAISDFGLSVKYKRKNDEIDFGNENTRIGTLRYMPPEVLNETIKATEFDSFKMADMYSVGLCYWEMSRRCFTTVSETNVTTCEDYALPYFDVVSSEPCLDDMRDVVCIKGIRPIIPEQWRDEKILLVLGKIMQECWHPNPSVRLSALRVKKSLGNVETKEDCGDLKAEP